MRQKEKTSSYVRYFVFGVEDSIVSTAGLLSGIAIAGMPGKTILLTGTILIIVEAFSMAIGSFVSEYSAEDYMKQRATRSGVPIIDGVIMFVSYFIAGFIPLFPYAIFPLNIAFTTSIISSLIALSALGYAEGWFSKTSKMKGAIKMSLMAGIAIFVGVMAGKLLA
ncbi:hypothetical protein A3A21_00445 [Candidatus Jorgensenbacteria bacterium RIFCSPLOWO2_01_FULL_45_25b]|uniref:VIT family protein n=1 Tax=Candidatus Jorgensenbacteria bacterium RIFCSPLOWO2_01_FULL_45_25b TaxID=1798471 RepID=A0A1F6BS46_9BACT|nr:MAG: hypothetical protein A3A21_00445 [Candidatus Jorgensenbacteria bacterium RIFCSPLOWO2_01_FULL_45_25b]